jgi:hypothetical protein
MTKDFLRSSVNSGFEFSNAKKKKQINYKNGAMNLGDEEENPIKGRKREYSPP